MSKLGIFQPPMQRAAFYARGEVAPISFEYAGTRGFCYFAKRIRQNHQVMPIE